MKTINLLLVFIFSAALINAQTVDDVTLVVSGDGATKEEATYIALRSAIEQAYGVFVSANTEILNDELVKDEIATVASGNVKSYTELSATVLPNGNHMVSLQAVVSTKKLSAYAQSKGVSCEFAGATFGANLKLHELNCKNTEIAFNNLRKQIKALAPYIFSVKLELGDPVIGGNQKAELPYTISLYSTPQTNELSDLIITTLSALKLSPEQANSVIQMNLPHYELSVYTQYVFNVEGELRGDPAVGGPQTKDTYWKNDEPWNQPLFTRIKSDDLKLFPWEYKYNSESYYYAHFPVRGVRNEIFESLPSYCIIDNLGNQYNSFRLEYPDYVTITLSERIKTEIINIGRYGFKTSLDGGRRSGLYAHNQACFVFFDENGPDSEKIYLPYSYIAPKVTKKATKKKPAEVIYTPKLIGRVKHSVMIPVDVLTKVTNFELKQIE